MKGHWTVSVLVSILIVGGFGLSQPAFAVPTSVSFVNDPNCDPLSVPPNVDELGLGIFSIPNGPFPDDEVITTSVFGTGLTPCPSAPDGPDPNFRMRIENFSPTDFVEVWYVADPDTTITNYDGFVNGERAFKIDGPDSFGGCGVNCPLTFEVLTQDGIFESGEIWNFDFQDYSNAFGLPAGDIDSLGVPSVSSPTGPSSGSIIAIDAFGEISVVGGTILPIDTTALLVAGAQTTTPWLILGVLSAVGIGLAVFTLKRSR